MGGIGSTSEPTGPWHRDVFLTDIFSTDILLTDTFSTGHIFDGTYFRLVIEWDIFSTT